MHRRSLSASGFCSTAFHSLLLLLPPLLAIQSRLLHLPVAVVGFLVILLFSHRPLTCSLQLLVANVDSVVLRIHQEIYKRGASEVSNKQTSCCALHKDYDTPLGKSSAKIKNSAQATVTKKPVKTTVTKKYASKTTFKVHISFFFVHSVKGTVCCGYFVLSATVPTFPSTIVYSDNGTIGLQLERFFLCC